MSSVEMLASPTLGCYLICGAACLGPCSADGAAPIVDVVTAAGAFGTAGGK